MFGSLAIPAPATGRQRLMLRSMSVLLMPPAHPSISDVMFAPAGWCTSKLAMYATLCCVQVQQRGAHKCRWLHTALCLSGRRTAWHAGASDKLRPCAHDSLAYQQTPHAPAMSQCQTALHYTATAVAVWLLCRSAPHHCIMWSCVYARLAVPCQA